MIPVNLVNNMAADALALCIARSSAAMVLTTGKYDEQVLIFNKEDNQLSHHLSIKK